MSDQTIAEELMKSCNGKDDCKGYGIHKPGCKKNEASNKKYRAALAGGQALSEGKASLREADKEPT